MGAALGNIVVGINDGIIVGIKEGRSVGSSVGAKLTEGSTVGDGDILGLGSVGNTVGVVGARVGLTLGLIDG